MTTVRILDSETSRERLISEAEANRILDEGAGRLLHPGWDDSGHMLLKDMVDGTEMRVPKQLALEQYLRKVVYVCSACTYASVWAKDAEGHLGQVGDQYRRHVRARMVSLETEQGVTQQRCTGCGEKFQTRKGQGQMHLQRIREAFPLHKNAKISLRLRYSLALPRPQGVTR